jgi:hypothetical protein
LDEGVHRHGPSPGRGRSWGFLYDSKDAAEGVVRGDDFVLHPDPGPTINLTSADADKTIAGVPARLTLTLPYAPPSGLVWELVSGAAGFSVQKGPIFTGASAAVGNEEFVLIVKDKGTIPSCWITPSLGRSTGKPNQFTLTLHGT